MPTQTSKPLAGQPADATSKPGLSRSAWRLRSLWIIIWAVMLFAPSIMLGFTATQSKFSSASIIAAIYLAWRLLFRPLPRLTGATGIGLAMGVYLLIHGLVLTITTGKIIILLLEGQWVVYFLSGLLLTMDIVRIATDVDWAGTTLIRLGLISSVLGDISLWTGPFYSYANNYKPRWGIDLNRACGPFESPAILGGLVMITFVLAFFTAPVAGGVLRRQAGLAFMMVTLLLSMSKAAIVSGLAATILGVPIVARTAAKRRAAVAKLLYVAVFIGAIGYISSAYMIDVRGLIEDDAQSRGAVGLTILSDYAQDGVLEQLFGIGYRQSASIDPETGMWFPAHNSYISFLREIGIVGFLSICGFLFYCLVELRSRGYLNWALALVALLLASYTAEYLYGSFCVFFLGCVGAIADRLRQFSAASAAISEACPEPL